MFSIAGCYNAAELYSTIRQILKQYCSVFKVCTVQHVLYRTSMFLSKALLKYLCFMTLKYLFWRKPNEKIMPNVLHNIGNTPMVKINKIDKSAGLNCELCMNFLLVILFFKLRYKNKYCSRYFEWPFEFRVLREKNL